MADNNALFLDGIRAILFDLDGTLRHERPSFHQALFELTVQAGLPGSEEKRRRVLRWFHYYWAQSPELLQDFHAFEGNWDPFLTRFLQRYLVFYGYAPERAATLAPEIYPRLEAARQLRENWIAPDTLPTLQALQEAGFSLGIVSNRSAPFHDLVDVLGLGPYFDFVLAACEVDSWKPDVEIFQHALQRAGSRPECTLYVGDNYYADVVGARRAGLKPVLLDPDGIFPDAECPVIRSLKELQEANAWQGVE